MDTTKATLATDIVKPIRLAWTPNAGQYHAGVLAVAPWPESMRYPGAGVAGLLVNEAGEVTGVLDYNRLQSAENCTGVYLPDGRVIPWGEHADPSLGELDELMPDFVHVAVGNFEIIAEKRTRAAKMIRAGGL